MGALRVVDGFRRCYLGSRLVFKLFGLGFMMHFGLGFRENFEERVSAGMVQEHEPMDPPLRKWMHEEQQSQSTACAQSSTMGA